MSLKLKSGTLISGILTSGILISGISISTEPMPLLLLASSLSVFSSINAIMLINTIKIIMLTTITATAFPPLPFE